MTAATDPPERDAQHPLDVNQALAEGFGGTSPSPGSISAGVVEMPAGERLEDFRARGDGEPPPGEGRAVVTPPRPVDQLVAAMAHHDVAALAPCLHPEVDWSPLSVVFGGESGPSSLRGRSVVLAWLADTQGVSYHVDAVVHSQINPDQAIVALSVGREHDAAPSTVTVYGLISYEAALVRTARAYPTEEAARTAARRAGLTA